MFKIDFTRPHLYEDVVTLNQGNLSTNNTLRCRITTGGNDDVTGASIVCTFVINGKQIFESGKVVDGPRGIVDVIFPSEALVVGENTLEFLVNRIDGSVAQSPVIKYRVWQGLTTDEGVRADSNYPLLVELINQANSAVNSANEALEGANSVIAQGDELKASVDKLKADCIASVNSFTEENSAKIDNVITQNVAKIDAAIVKNEASIVKADTATEKAILAANNSDTKTAENIKNVNAAIAAGTQDLEVKAARVDMDGVEHGSLKERLESDLKKGKLIEETKEGTYLSFNDTVEGLVSDIEVLGNTVQDASNLANIKSSCTPNGDGTFKMSILSCGENLFNGKWQHDTSINAQGQLVFSNDRSTSLDYIKVSQNEKISCFSDRGGFNNVYCFDSKLNYLGIATYNATTIVTMPNTCYIKINIVKSGVNYDKFSVYKGEYKAVYTPYQETRCDIKLPCQLEKWDKLYFDNGENAWVVDKKTVTINPLDYQWTRLESYSNVSRMGIHYSHLSQIKAKPSNDAICNALPHMDGNVDTPHIRVDGTTPYGAINLYIPTLNATQDDVYNMAKASNMYIKYCSMESIKIVLPQSEQIKLNSFASKTHIYTISGEVDATVKATVSKSLASTVQANTEEISKINNTIADIQGLKESQDFEYETDKGYLVCKDTQNGVVKDLKVYGRTKLVNAEGIEVEPGTDGATLISVGNGNEIEVLSVNSNILNKDKLLSISTTVFPTIKNNGFEVDYSSVISIPYYEVMSTNEMFLSLNVVKKGSGDVIVRGYKNIDDLKSSSNFTFNKGISLIGNITGIQIPMGTNFIAFHRGNSSAGLVEIDNIMVTFDSSIVKYISHSGDKKPILFKDTDGAWKPVLNLRGIDENNCDIVDSGKGKLVKKYNQMNINKNLNIILNDATKTNTIAFEVVVNDAKPGSFSVSNNKCICSKFKNITYGIDEVGFSGTSSNAFVFRINKTDLQTQDVEGCKKWLETNSFDIVYELNEYKECEINPIYPESYVDETMIAFGSGAIVPHASWKITSSLPNFVQSIEDRVCRLENDAYKVNLANFTVALNMLDMKVRLESLEAPIN